MKKAFLSILIMLSFSGWISLRADVAVPHPVTMRQPDGSTVVLRIHGDEFGSWYTSEDGRTAYRLDSDGWWRPAGAPGPNRTMIAGMNAARQARDAALAQVRDSGIGMGEKHFLVILVDWSDQQFCSGAGEYFTRALNENGFSDYGSFGSARDYFMDASYGQFRPVFDVYGPITLTRRHDEWPSDDSAHHYQMARTMIKEAADLLDGEVDFSIYDTDADGRVDSIYMLYAGYAQSNGGGPDTIWPHSSSLGGGVVHDGVQLRSYACSAELRSNSGTERNGIGTFCHEFGHVIGLPDLYDTDYEENGPASNPSSWNLMSGGNHNGKGRIPARMSVYERYILGYIPELQQLDTPGQKRVSGLDASTFYYIPTINDGEFFLPEVRDGRGFDSTLPQGMIIYHVDRSQNMVSGMTAEQRWDKWNKINGYSYHPCHYLLIPDDSVRPYGMYSMYDDQYKNNFYSLWVFPKNQDWSVSYDVRDYKLIAWDGSNPFNLSEIDYTDQEASFVLSRGARTVSGVVTDIATGAPVEGAVVLISAEGPNSSRARAMQLSAARSSASYEAVTDSNGQYLITVDNDFSEQMDISVFATNYHPAHLSGSGWALRKDVCLESVISGGVDIGLSKARFPIQYYGSWGYDTPDDYSVAQHYTADELKDYAGGIVNSIAFSTKASNEVWVFIDYGTRERAFVRRVENVSTSVYSSSPVNFVDISDAEVLIPEDTDLYVGYLIRQSNASYPMVTDYDTPNEGGFQLYYGFSTTTTPGEDAWFDPNAKYGWPAGNALISISLQSPHKLNPATTISDLGISYIDLPSGPLYNGDTMPLKLVISPSERPKQAVWYYDGLPAEGNSVVLTSGTHTIVVRLSYADGREERLESQIVVQ